MMLDADTKCCTFTAGTFGPLADALKHSWPDPPVEDVQHLLAHESAPTRPRAEAQAHIDLSSSSINYHSSSSDRPQRMTVRPRGEGKTLTPTTPAAVEAARKTAKGIIAARSRRGEGTPSAGGEAASPRKDAPASAPAAITYTTHLRSHGRTNPSSYTRSSGGATPTASVPGASPRPVTSYFDAYPNRRRPGSSSSSASGLGLSLGSTTEPSGPVGDKRRVFSNNESSTISSERGSHAGIMLRSLRKRSGTLFGSSSKKESEEQHDAVAQEIPTSTGGQIAPAPQHTLSRSPSAVLTELLETQASARHRHSIVPEAGPGSSSGSRRGIDMSRDVDKGKSLPGLPTLDVPAVKVRSATLTSNVPPTISAGPSDVPVPVRDSTPQPRTPPPMDRSPARSAICLAPSPLPVPPSPGLSVASGSPGLAAPSNGMWTSALGVSSYPCSPVASNFSGSGWASSSSAGHGHTISGAPPSPTMHRLRRSKSATSLRSDQTPSHFGHSDGSNSVNHGPFARTHWPMASRGEWLGNNPLVPIEKEAVAESVAPDVPPKSPIPASTSIPSIDDIIRKHGPALKLAAPPRRRREVSSGIYPASVPDSERSASTDTSGTLSSQQPRTPTDTLVSPRRISTSTTSSAAGKSVLTDAATAVEASPISGLSARPRLSAASSYASFSRDREYLRDDEGTLAEELDEGEESSASVYDSDDSLQAELVHVMRAGRRREGASMVAQQTSERRREAEEMQERDAIHAIRSLQRDVLPSSASAMERSVSGISRRQSITPSPRASPTPSGKTRRRADSSISAGSVRSARQGALGTPTPGRRQAKKEAEQTNSFLVLQYLRSPRLTTLLRLSKWPNEGLQVSLADVGDPQGMPVFVFLGLAAVRYLVGLYDEVAQVLGLRLICIDRWGLGKTDEVKVSRRGPMDWPSVVSEVAGKLGIAQFSLLAHSAGAPYCVATALAYPNRIRGAIHLLAPWVSTEFEGYNWVKYLPDRLIRTAQAAEWKMQAWKLGKLPAMTEAEIAAVDCAVDKFGAPESVEHNSKERSMGPGIAAIRRIPSLRLPSSSERRSSMPRRSTIFTDSPVSGESEVLRSPSMPVPPRTRNSSAGSTLTTDSATRSELEVKMQRRTSQGFSKSAERPDFPPLFPASGSTRRTNTSARTASTSSSTLASSAESRKHSRQLSGSSSHGDLFSTAAQSRPSTSSTNSDTAGFNITTALLQASLAESTRSSGVAMDLQCILGSKGSKAWGFSFADIKHPVKVWHGDCDEKISSAGVAWMQKTLGDLVEAKMVKGAGHSLMLDFDVVMQALER